MHQQIPSPDASLNLTRQARWLFQHPRDLSPTITLSAEAVRARLSSQHLQPL